MVFFLAIDFSSFRGMLVSLSRKTCFLLATILLCPGAVGRCSTMLKEPICGCLDQSKKYYYDLEPLGFKEGPRFADSNIILGIVNRVRRE